MVWENTKYRYLLFIQIFTYTTNKEGDYIQVKSFGSIGKSQRILRRLHRGKETLLQRFPSVSGHQRLRQCNKGLWLILCGMQVFHWGQQSRLEDRLIDILLGEVKASVRPKNRPGDEEKKSDSKHGTIFVVRVLLCTLFSGTNLIGKSWKRWIQSD